MRGLAPRQIGRHRRAFELHSSSRIFLRVNPCGLRPGNGLLKRMNSAFVRGRLSRKNCSRGAKLRESWSENVSNWEFTGSAVGLSPNVGHGSSTLGVEFCFRDWTTSRRSNRGRRHPVIPKQGSDTARLPSLRSGLAGRTKCVAPTLASRHSSGGFADY